MARTAAWVQTGMEMRRVDLGDAHGIADVSKRKVEGTGLGNWVECRWCHSLRQRTIAKTDREGGGNLVGTIPRRQAPWRHSRILSYLYSQREGQKF